MEICKLLHGCWETLESRQFCYTFWLFCSNDLLQVPQLGNIQGKGDIRVTDVENTQETLDADFKNVENFENIHVTDVENTQKKYGGCDSGKVENFGNI